MSLVLALWSSVIPQFSLELRGGSVMAAATCALLGICAFGLWLQRERPASHPEPIHVDEETPIAA